MRGAPIVRAFHAAWRRSTTTTPTSWSSSTRTSPSRPITSSGCSRSSSSAPAGIAAGSAMSAAETAMETAPRNRRQASGAPIAPTVGRACGHPPARRAMGWDTMISIKATVRGWSTSVSRHPFRHHRVEGKPRRRRARRRQSRGARRDHMGYRPSYMLVRTLYRAVQEPSALALMRGSLAAALKREPKCQDIAVRNFIRRSQACVLPRPDGRGAPPARGPRPSRRLALPKGTLAPSGPANADLVGSSIDPDLVEAAVAEPPDDLGLGVPGVELGDSASKQVSWRLRNRPRPHCWSPRRSGVAVRAERLTARVDRQQRDRGVREAARNPERTSSGSRVTRSASSTSS